MQNRPLPRLEKLSIEAFSDIERTARIGAKLEAQFNPEQLSLTHSNDLQDRPAITSDAAAGLFANAKPRSLNLKLVFDGTDVGRAGDAGASQGPSVQERVAQFITLTHSVVSTSHEPPYLRISWGSSRVFGNRGFKCRLKQVTTTYTAFDRDGTPLRAELDATFVDAIKDVERRREARMSSPDVTHHRVVRSGDTLPALCREIYGSAVHYLRVAAVNGLDDLRALSPGSELVFPPYDRKEQP